MESIQCEGARDGMVGALAIGLDSAEAAAIGLRIGATISGPVAPARRGMIGAMAARAECIVTRLVAEGYDVIDLAEWLAFAGFRGRLVVLTPRLPLPEIVAREIAAACPQARVALMPLARH